MRKGAPAPPPSSLYRLQLTPTFRFDDARRAIPYLVRLGVGGIYLSPVLRSASGSAHGYDVIDPTRLSDERGGSRSFRALVRTAHRHGLSVLLDIVPNHQAAIPENPAWWDVLAHGPASPYARWFDIDWDAATRGRPAVIYPVLPERWDRMVQAGTLRYRPAEGGPELDLPGGVRLPLAADRPPSADGGGPRDLRAWSRLLMDQWYRLIPGSEGDRRVNYRRFFQVASLVGVRVEDPATFRSTHRWLRTAARNGWIDGVRVDHIDGLRDPCEYLRRLRTLLGPGPRIWVEKIRWRDERLPSDWPIEGTTGYDALDAITGLFAPPDLVRRMDRQFRRSGAAATSFGERVRRAKVAAVRDWLIADVGRAARAWRPWIPWAGGPRPPPEVERSLVELLAGVPVYRTYVCPSGRSHPPDRRAMRTWARRLPRGPPTLGALRRALVQTARGRPPKGFLGGWATVQQLTPAVAAKGVEDRVLYDFPRWLALNEVGGTPDPDPRIDPIRRFHRFFTIQARQSPHALTTTATHDTKRGEDVRARLLALPYCEAAWSHLLASFDRWRARRRTVARLHPEDRYALLQTIVATWPVAAVPGPTYFGRLASYWIKYVREGGRRSHWKAPRKRYEATGTAVLEALSTAPADDPIRQELRSFVGTLARLGAEISLAQLALKMTVPGVPDLYQGNELWDDSLVDPDNRRPVDFPARRCALRSIARQVAEERPALDDLCSRWWDGRVKLYATARFLRHRREHPGLWGEGTYRPVFVRGTPTRHVAFLRSTRRDATLVIVRLDPRGPRTAAPAPASGWLRLPEEGEGRWKEIWTGRTLTVRRGRPRIPLASLLDRFPMAAWTIR
ncbi:MAG: malto-oligosyltrehalose synthase [Thermoplasmata archaeon]